MPTGDRPTISVSLGISTEAKPSVADFIRRSREQMAVVAAGQTGLTFLHDEESILKSRMNVGEDKEYSLVVDIPPEPQKALIVHEPRGRRGQDLLRNDDDEVLIDKVVALVKKSSDLVVTIADVLSTSDNPAAELRLLECRDGCDTQPIRKFLYGAQSDFTVDVEETEVVFENRQIRARVMISESIQVVAVLAPREEVVVEKGQVLQVSDRPGGGGLMAGGKREFKFGHLDPLQNVLLFAAREFKIPVKFLANEEISTCTLNFRPHDVTQVDNWDEIAAKTIGFLQGVEVPLPRESSNDNLNSGPELDGDVGIQDDDLAA